MKAIKLAILIAFITGFIGSQLYKSVDVSGQEGGSDLTAPTGIVASDNSYNNKVGLYWDAVRDATTYRIFRNSVNDPNTATDIGSTGTIEFFDTTATPGQTSFYWVRAENATSQSSMSAAEQGTRANGNQQGPVAPLNPPPPAPPGNPTTGAKAFLGKTLFWDEQLSSTKTVSCGTCHHADTGGVDPRSAITATNNTHPGPDLLLGTPDDVRGSAGVPSSNADGTYVSIPTYGLRDQVTGRRSVSSLNAAYAPTLFWDGRATGIFRDPITNNVILNGGAALESQAAGPPLSSAEMAHNGRDWNDVANRVKSSRPLALSPTIPNGLNTWLGGRNYEQLFQEAFGTTDVTPSRIIMAIAAYERILYTDRTAFDLDVAGIQPLSAAATRGRGVFNASSCNVCHAGSLFTDNTFRYIGVRPQNEDTGRFQVTGVNGDIGAFRVPGLRNVAQRGTFFHNGQFTTLQQVVAFYNRGGDFNGPNKPLNLIRPLGLGAGQQADLVAFLQSLSDQRASSETERFDRPALYIESNRVPVLTGASRNGSGGFAPTMMAKSPPIVGNQEFIVSVSAALGNSQAVLVIDDADLGIGSTIPATATFARVVTTTQGTGSGNGWASVKVAIPDLASMVGRTLFARWYVVDPAAANGFSASAAARFTIFGTASAVPNGGFVDFDGDTKTDISVFRPSEANWYIIRSSDSTVTTTNFGQSSDRITPADFDGDGKTDIATFRNGTWSILRSQLGTTTVSFGLSGDIPQPGDYDGDGRADIAIFRPVDGNWWWLASSDGVQRAAHWGISTDKPTAADFDGDGKVDLAIYRDGLWYILGTGGSTVITHFGLAGDKPVVGDYDNDGKADIAVWRPTDGIWYHMRSSDGGFRAQQFGLSGDVPSPGDYDGDGSNDLGIYRGGTWYLQRSTGGFAGSQFGLPTDIPAPSAFVP
jgi:cytochrome c peroxidase